MKSRSDEGTIQVVVATQHGKEKLFAPLVSDALGWSVFPSQGLDTDVFGMFTGEVPRTGSPLDTLRAKCRAGIQLAGCTRGFASEGSFGPHPSVFFAPGNEEWAIYLDDQNNLEVVGRFLTLETNFSQLVCRLATEWEPWLEKIGFPSHAVLVRSPQDPIQVYGKGIQNRAELRRTFDACLKDFGLVQLETDMRAHVNPTRQKAITEAIRRLVNKLKTECTACKSPGFGVSRALPGLPCSRCGCPTDSTLAFVHTCPTCSHEEHESFPHGKKTEDPRYCPQCNP
jgi:hypothetical protein